MLPPDDNQNSEMSTLNNNVNFWLRALAGNDNAEPRPGSVFRLNKITIGWSDKLLHRMANDDYAREIELVAGIDKHK